VSRWRRLVAFLLTPNEAERSPIVEAALLSAERQAFALERALRPAALLGAITVAG
jgi:hypothetical protein